MVSIVLGSQWGDEGETELVLYPRNVAAEKMITDMESLGKGKITDMLSQQATLCCRAAGGHSKSITTKVSRSEHLCSFFFHFLFSMASFWRLPISGLTDLGRLVPPS